MSEVLKPKDRPGRHAIGRIFTGYSIKHEKSAQYFCDSCDPRIGFWMTNVEDPEDRSNVSERAIGRTYHRAYTHAADKLAAEMGGQPLEPTE